MAIFKGLGVAMATPMTAEGINYKELDKLIEHLIGGKTDAIFVLGTTGEPSTMTKAEKLSLLDYTIKKVNKRIPVFAGTGGNNTKDSAEFSKECEKLSPDGFLVVTPYYNKCTQNGVVMHYKAICESVKLPVIAYNVPTRTGFNIAPATMVKLAEIKNIIAVKEASGDIDQILEVARLLNGKMDFYSGDDSLTVPAMSLGAKGVISVAGNIIPDIMHDITALCFDNKYPDAAALHFKVAVFIKCLFSEVNPIPVKKALRFLGIDAGIPRLPLTEMEPAHADILKQEMQQLGLI